MMYISIYGCSQWGYEEPLPWPDMFDRRPGETVSCTDSRDGGVLAVLFWLLFFITVAFIVLNLFVGVVTSSMEHTSSSRHWQKHHDFLMSQLKRWHPKMDENYMRELEEAFSAIDSTNTGYVSLNEMEDALESDLGASWTVDHRQALRNLINAQGGDKVFLADFISATLAHGEQGQIELSRKLREYTRRVCTTSGEVRGFGIVLCNGQRSSNLLFICMTP